MAVTILTLTTNFRVFLWHHRETTLTISHYQSKGIAEQLSAFHSPRETRTYALDFPTLDISCKWVLMVDCKWLPLTY